MNFDVDENTPKKFRTDVCLVDTETGRVFSDNLRMIYLMLPLFTKEEDECETDFERWIFVLKNMSTLERMPFMARNAVFQKLAEIADITALSKEDREKYDDAIKVMRDHIAAYKGAIIEAKIEVAKNMLMENEPVDKIARYTGLAKEDILKLN